MYRNNNKVFSQQQFKHPDAPQQLLCESTGIHTAPYSLRPSKLLLILFPVLIIAAVCLLPWPTRIDLTMPGARITSDGDIVQETSIRLLGWQYDYLFRQDSMCLRLDISDLDLSASVVRKEAYYPHHNCRWLYQEVYAAELNGYLIAKIVIADDNTWCRLQIGEYQYYGSIDPAADMSAIPDIPGLIP